MTLIWLTPGTVPPEELSALADLLSTAPGASSRHGALLQYAAAAAAAFGGSRAAHWDTLQRKEHALIRAAAEGASIPFNYLGVGGYAGRQYAEAYTFCICSVICRVV